MISYRFAFPVNFFLQNLLLPFLLAIVQLQVAHPVILSIHQVISRLVSLEIGDHHLFRFSLRFHPQLRLVHSGQIVARHTVMHLNIFWHTKLSDRFELAGARQIFMKFGQALAQARHDFIFARIVVVACRFGHHARLEAEKIV